MPNFIPETAQRLAFWMLCYALLWLLLSTGKGWAMGLGSLLLAGGVAAMLKIQSWSFRLRYLPPFLGFLLTNAFHDALRVALRSLRPKHTSASNWIYYRLRTQDPRTRLVLTSMLGLFPGTLAARVEGDVLHIHVLDGDASGEKRALQLEQQLIRLLGAGQHRSKNRDRA
jgi:multicomponent Na+:H+ antiporter subunit E